VQIKTNRVTKIEKDGGLFTVFTPGRSTGRTVVVSTGVSDVLPPIEHLHRSWVRATLPASIATVTVRQARSSSSPELAQRRQPGACHEADVHKDTTFIPYELSLPPSLSEVLADEGILSSPESPSGSSARRSWKGSSLRTVRV